MTDVGDSDQAQRNKCEMVVKLVGSYCIQTPVPQSENPNNWTFWTELESLSKASPHSADWTTAIASRKDFQSYCFPLLAVCGSSVEHMTTMLHFLSSFTLFNRNIEDLLWESRGLLHQLAANCFNQIVMMDLLKVLQALSLYHDFLPFINLVTVLAVTKLNLLASPTKTGPLLDEIARCLLAHGLECPHFTQFLLTQIPERGDTLIRERGKIHLYASYLANVGKHKSTAFKVLFQWTVDDFHKHGFKTTLLSVFSCCGYVPPFGQQLLLNFNTHNQGSYDHFDVGWELSNFRRKSPELPGAAKIEVALAARIRGEYMHSPGLRVLKELLPCALHDVAITQGRLASLCLLDDNSDALLPWPSDYTPAELTHKVVKKLPGTPVAVVLALKRLHGSHPRGEVPMTFRPLEQELARNGWGLVVVSVRNITKTQISPTDRSDVLFSFLRYAACRVKAARG